MRHTWTSNERESYLGTWSLENELQTSIVCSCKRNLALEQWLKAMDRITVVLISIQSWCLWMAHFLLVPEKVQARGSAKVSNGFNQFEAGQSKCWEHTRAVSVLYVILWSWRLKEYLGSVAYWKCSTRSNPNFPSCTLKPTGLSA